MTIYDIAHSIQKNDGIFPIEAGCSDNQVFA